MGFTGAFLDKFEVIRTLGQGGMGQVLLAKRRSDGQSVAIKVIAAGSFSDQESRQRFLMEAEVTRRLDHPAIVRVVEHGMDGDQLYLALELVGGGDLEGCIRSGPLDPAMFWRVARPVVEGVGFAHQQGILHRDIKGANILLDEGGNPRIADFGIAKDLAGGGVRTATGVIMGTPAYMAPELARGQKAGPACDQYALGILLFEMLAGVRPFEAAEPMAMLRMHLDEPVPSFGSLRRDVPPALDAAVRRALEKDPARRFPDLQAMAAVLARVEAEAGNDWKRFRRTGKAPALTAGVTAAGPPVRRNTGITRRQRVTSSLGVAVPAAQATAGAGPWRRVGTLAVVLGTLSIAAGVLVWRAAPRDPPVTAEQVASLKLKVERHLNAVNVRWEPPLTASRAIARWKATQVTAVATSSVTLAPIGPRAGQDARVELSFPGLPPAVLGFEFDDINVPLVAGRIRTLRRAVAAALPVKRALLGPPERAIFLAFANAMMAPSPPASLGGNYDDLHPAEPGLRKEKAIKAGASSGLSGALDRLRTSGLPELLRQASLLLNQTGTSNGDAYELLAEIQPLAELYCFAELGDLPVGENDPLRFLYALPPGPLVTSQGKVLDGSVDYRRSRWRLRLVETEGLAEWFDRYYRPGLKDYGRTAAELHRVVSGDDLVRAASGKPAQDASLRDSGTPSKPFKGIALEFAEAQIEGFMSKSGLKTTTASFDLLLPDEERTPLPHDASVVLDARMGPRVRVDISPFKKGKPEGSLSFRLPPEYMDCYADGKHVTRRVLLAWELPAGALKNKEGSRIDVVVRCAPGEGDFKDILHVWEAWEVRLDSLLFWMHPIGGGIPE